MKKMCKGIAKNQEILFNGGLNFADGPPSNYLQIFLFDVLNFAKNLAFCFLGAHYKKCMGKFYQSMCFQICFVFISDEYDDILEEKMRNQRAAEGLCYISNCSGA